MKLKLVLILMLLITISAIAEILYNKFKHKNHDIIYHTTVSYDGINKPFKIRINYANK